MIIILRNFFIQHFHFSKHVGHFEATLFSCEGFPELNIFSGSLSCLVPSGSLGKCLRRFATKEKLQEHMKLVHKIAYSTCSLCNMVFENRNDKREHNSTLHPYLEELQEIAVNSHPS